MMANHRPHVPHYHNQHVHDACHSLAIVLAAILGFYTIIVLLISFTKYVPQNPAICSSSSSESRSPTCTPQITSDLGTVFGYIEMRAQSTGQSEH